MIPIGEQLNKVFRKKNISRPALSIAMHCSPSSIHNDLKNESIQISKLLEYCKYAEHNFFMDIAQQLPENYTTGDGVFDDKNSRIAQLEADLKTAQIERDILLKALGK